MVIDVVCVSRIMQQTVATDREGLAIQIIMKTPDRSSLVLWILSIKSLGGKTVSFVGQESANGSDLAEVWLIENMNLVMVNQESKNLQKSVVGMSSLMILLMMAVILKS